MAHGQGLGLKEQNNTLTMKLCHGRFSHKTEKDYSPILQNTEIKKKIIEFCYSRIRKNPKHRKHLKKITLEMKSKLESIQLSTANNVINESCREGNN